MRFFITLSYNGKNYVGWQIQPNGISVQQVLQDALSTILREQTEVVGAGRTDAGVHARKMTAHFDFSGAPFDEEELVKKLNSFLPRDIAVNEIRDLEAEKAEEELARKKEAEHQKAEAERLAKEAAEEAKIKATLGDRIKE